MKCVHFDDLKRNLEEVAPKAAKWPSPQPGEISGIMSCMCDCLLAYIYARISAAAYYSEINCLPVCCEATACLMFSSTLRVQTASWIMSSFYCVLVLEIFFFYSVVFIFPAVTCSYYFTECDWCFNVNTWNIEFCRAFALVICCACLSLSFNNR